MDKKITTIIVSGIFLLSIISLISAYDFGRFSYYNSPLDYLENAWIMFGIIFIILFGVMYYVLNKSFKNNAVAAAISLALALLISMAISQRGLLSEYGGGELSSWALVIASLIAIAFLIRFVSESFGKIGVVITLVLIWIILKSLEPYEVLPYSLLNSGFLVVYEFLTSWLSLIIMIGLGFAFGGDKGPLTLAAELQGLLGSRRR
jgi:hypothetical protein